MNYLYAFLAIIIALAVLKFILKLSVKIFSILFIILAILVTTFLVVIQPKMHKEFKVNVIQRVLKFNSDGGASLIETERRETTR